MARFACPLCKSVISASEEQRGAILACPSCAKQIKVPRAKPAAASDKVRAAAPPAGAAAQTSIEDDDAGDIPAPRSFKSQPPAKKRGVDEEDAERPAPPPLKRRPRDEDDEDEQPAPRRRKQRQEDDEDDAPRRRSALDDEEDENGERRTKKRRKSEGSSGVLAVTGVIGSIGTLLFIVLFFLILSGKAPRWLMDWIQEKLQERGIPPLVAIGVSAAVFLIPFGLWMLVATKGAILGAMPDDLDFGPAKKSKYPDLDTDTLDDLTETFESLGFEQEMDYTVRADVETFPKGFARLLINRDEHCYAEINQAFTPDGDAVPMRCMVASHLDDGWSLMTTDRAPSKESYLMRRPRAAWRSLPEKSPEELLNHHRKMRKKMMKTLEVGLEEGLSSSAYFKRERVANRERKEAVRGRWSAGILIEFFFFDRNPKYEWLGEYASLAD